MKKRFTFMKTLLVAVGLGMGASAWADATSLYERGTTNAWAEADLTDWVSSGCTPTVDAGLKVTTKNAEWTSTKSISVTANSIVTLDATLKTGGASGRNGSYDYVKIGGVTVGFKEQDKAAFVDVDGISTNLSLTYTRTTAYTIQVVINQATGVVSYKVGTVEGTSTSTTAITGVVFGHKKGGGENFEINPVLQKIEVSEEVQAVTMAGYKVKYVCGGVEIKDADDTRSGVVGTDVSLAPADKASFFNDGATKKYIYVSDDATGNAIAGDGSTVVTVTFREAASWGYTVNAMNGETKIEEVATGSTFELENVTIPFHKYYNIGGTLYEKGAVGSEYRQVINIDEDSKVVGFAYTATDKENVVYFKEAEDITTLTASTGGGTSTRCSYAQGAYADADAVITNLTPGKYILTGAGYGGNLVFKAGDTEVLNMAAAGYWRETASAEFSIVENTDITFKGGAAGGNASLDYVIIQRTGDITEVPITISVAGMATYVPAYDLDFSTAGIKAYKAKVTEKGVCKLTAVDEVPAGTPVLLIKDGGATESIPVMTGAAAVSDNDLVAGTGDAVDTEDGDYTNMILNNIDGNVGFYFAAGKTVAANRAYLHILTTLAPDKADGSRMTMVFGDETPTGISEKVTVNSEKFATAPVYNLNGQRVAQPTKGLYIVNGKKVVVK